MGVIRILKWIILFIDVMLVFVYWRILYLRKFNKLEDKTNIFMTVVLLLVSLIETIMYSVSGIKVVYGIVLCRTIYIELKSE